MRAIPVQALPKQHSETDKHLLFLPAIGNVTEWTWKRYTEAGMEYRSEHGDSKYRMALVVT